MNLLPDVPDQPGWGSRNLDRYRIRVGIETYKQYLAIKADEAVAETINRETAELGHESIDEIDFITHRGRQVITRNSDAEPGVAAVVTEVEVSMARVMRRFTSKQLDRLG